MNVGVIRADARDEKVWTNHAEEHRTEAPHGSNKKTVPVVRQWLLDRVPLGSLVVDFGCGSGLWMPIFEGYNYYGLDQNAKMIQVAHERYPDKVNRFKQISWNELPYEDNSVDVIFTSAVIQHNTHPDKEKVIREFYRVLKPGGYYVCTENTFRPDNYQTTFGSNTEFREDLNDGYSFTFSGWKKFMSLFGFKAIFTQEPSEYLYQKC